MSASEPRTARAPGARVLVVDDSAFMRRLVSDVIAESGEFEVVGTARDGFHALQQVQALNPDIVTLDVDMPGQDGLEALRQIMRDAPRPVVMLSAGGADQGVETTLRALELGAVEFVRKPSGAISLDLDDVRDHLLEALRAAACSSRQPPYPASATRNSSDAFVVGRPGRSTGTTSGHATRHACDVVCIAASTGGPAALAHLVPALPRFANSAVLIAQHMPAGFTRGMARRLNASAQLVVSEAEHNAPVLAGHVYLAPGGSHLRIGRVDGINCCLLDTSPALWGVRPAADHLFSSAAAAFGAACIGVVLTGMGRDGASGLRAIRLAGGAGIVQDAASSVVDVMPMSALQFAGAERVVALDRMADALVGLLEERSGAERLA